MKITECSIYILNANNEDRFKGYARIVLDDELVVSDIKIYNGNSGLYVNMPRRKGGDGEYRDIIFPLKKELRNHINDYIIKEFKSKTL